MSLKGRNFLTLLDFTPAEIEELLALAARHSISFCRVTLRPSLVR